jgi:drug/metabolite transporter superfamily protein YnfA
MRVRALRIVMAVAGLLFIALAYPLVMFVRREPSLAMMFSLYVTLGVFLLLSVRNPKDHRSLIAFAGWANIAHAALMVVQVQRHWIERQELIGVMVFGLIGLALVTLGPHEEQHP